jgi:hypothetical protein
MFAGLSSHQQALIVMACGLIAILIAAVGALAVPTSERVPQSAPADDGAAEGEEGLVDVVALNVVRRARREGRADIIPAGVGWLALRISRSIAAGSLAGAGGRCWSARGRPVA